MTTLRIIEPDSAFVRAVLGAGEHRRTIVQTGGRLPNAADTCHFDARQVAAIANVAFWSSIAVEEGRPVRGVLCVASPDEVPSALTFASPQPLSMDTVVALTTAVPEGALAVHTATSGDPEIWGVVDLPPMHALRLRIARPGTVIASVGSDVVALIHEGRVSVVQNVSDVSWMSVVAAAFGTELPFPVRMVKAARFLRIVSSMLRHGHGGTLVLVPSASAGWREHVSIKYSFSGTQGSNVLQERLAQSEAANEKAEELKQALLLNRATEIPQNLIPLKLQIAESHARLVTEMLRRIGALTAVDGAVVVGEDLSLYGFGAKLQAPPKDFNLTTFDVLDRSLHEGVSVSEIRGTRHQSAACFIKCHNDSLAFVASQDGQLTLFAWVMDRSTVFSLCNLHHMIWEY